MAFERTVEQSVCHRLWSLRWDEEDFLPDNFSMKEIFQERFCDLGVAVVLDLPVGQRLTNQALPIMTMARLDGQKGTLELLS